MSASTPQSNFTNNLPKSPTVWVVDDDPLVTTSVDALLSLETDYQVHTFNAPQQALDALTQGTEPDLIISDFLMPEMDGIQFLSRAKQQLPNTTMVLLTGYADKENAIAAINEAGIYKYLEKPWDNADLLQTLSQGLERAYLVRRLEETIAQLQAAQAQLKAHNIELTDTVAQQQQTLALTHQQLDAIVRSSEDGIITVTAQGKILSCNPAIHQMSGVDALDETSHLSALMTSPDFLLSLLAAHQATGQLPQTVIESRIGQTPVELSVSPISQVGQQDPFQYVLIARDVTRRKLVERLREDFVATLTHDLRVPLLAAVQTLTLMRDGATGNLTEQQYTLIATMIESQQDLLNMVNTLLDIYRYESEQYPLVLERVDMKHLAEQVVAELNSLAEKKQQRLLLDFSAESPALVIQGDRQELKRVWINLVGNAIVHTQAHGTITLGQDFDNTAHEVRFWVRDTGRGIPEADLKTLFERFSQGTSNVRSSGSGLGLYLAQHIMQAHGASLRVESQVGKGACFTMAFPYHNALVSP